MRVGFEFWDVVRNIIYWYWGGMGNGDGGGRDGGVMLGGEEEVMWRWWDGDEGDGVGSGGICGVILWYWVNYFLDFYVCRIYVEGDWFVD